MLLEIDGLSIRYGAVRALEQVSISVEEGEVVALIGANGAGKSTTLRAVSRLIPFAAGDVRYEGKSLRRLPPDRVVAAGVVQVPEGRQILARQSVEDNLLLGAYLRSDRRSVAEDLERVYRSFPRLRERRRQVGGTLSGGEQQMLAIGRALMSKPRLLLLDEPSLGLAPLLVREIFSVIDGLRQGGISILLVEQNAKLALQAASRGYVLEAGRLRFSGPSHELLHDDRVRRAYLG